MNKNTSKIILALLTVLVALAAGYYVLLFLYISISRMAFPLTLDWVEGAMLVQANRILLGQKLYLESGIHYIPLVYQPLYFYIAAIFIKLLGVGLMPLRLVSVLSTCGCILMIFLVTKKISGSTIAAVASAGLFAAINPFVRMWFDLARVDMLCIFFFMAGLYFVIQDDRRSSILAGILFALSFFTKQSTAPIIFLIFAYYFFVKRPRALISIIVFGLFVGAGTLALTLESNGLYLFYIYKLPTYHRLYTEISYFQYMTISLLQPVLMVVGVICLSMLANLKKMLRNHEVRLLIIITIPAVLLSISSALMAGSSRNALIPAYALIAVLFGVGLAYLKNNSEEFSGGNFSFIGTACLLCICLLQFSSLQYNASDYIPTGRDYQEASRLINSLKETNEEVLLPTQNYLALYTNKKVYYHNAAFGEFTGEFGIPLSQLGEIKDEIVATVRSKEISYIYIDKPKDIWLGMKCKTVDIFESNSKFIKTLYKMTCH